MRTTFLIALLFSVIVVKAQTMSPGNLTNYTQPENFTNNIYRGDSLPQKKWFFTRYSGISTGFAFFKGGQATIFSAPMSLQLNRRLNNNWYAFANITVAPAYTDFNRSFISENYNKASQKNGFYNSRGVGMYSGASLGLMYVNEKKTFSISGSISAEKSSYPMLPYYPINTTRRNQAVPANR